MLRVNNHSSQLARELEKADNQPSPFSESVQTAGWEIKFLVSHPEKSMDGKPTSYPLFLNPATIKKAWTLLN